MDTPVDSELLYLSCTVRTLYDTARLQLAGGQTSIFGLDLVIYRRNTRRKGPMSIRSVVRTNQLAFSAVHSADSDRIK